MFVRVANDATKPLGESLGVAVFTSRADLGTPAQGVPCRVCPFNFGMVAHALGPTKRFNNISIVPIRLNLSKQKVPLMFILQAASLSTGGE